MSKLTTTSAVRSLRKAAKSAGVQVGRIAISDRTEVGLIDNTTKCGQVAFSCTGARVAWN